MLVPFRNTTSQAVSMQRETAGGQPAAITGITAQLTGTGSEIALSFRSSNPARDLLVFWASSPLLTAEDLLHGTSQALDPGVQRYLLTAPPGADYYFAVLDAGMYKVGQTPLAPGQNATVEPVRVPRAAAGAQGLPPEGRTMPLPSLQLASTVEGGRELPGGEQKIRPTPRPVSAETEQAISRVLGGIKLKEIPEMTAQVLEEDRAPGAGGERAALLQIVTGSFSSGRYGDAEKLIRNFLNVPRDPEIEARARFYLGQALYLSGQPRDAVMEFLVAEDRFCRDTRPWLDYFWGVLLRAYREFEKRVGTLTMGRGSKTQQVRDAVGRRMGPFAISGIEADCPGVSRDMVRVVLRQLRDEGAITPQGKGRGAHWIRRQE